MTIHANLGVNIFNTIEWVSTLDTVDSCIDVVDVQAKLVSNLVQLTFNVTLDFLSCCFEKQGGCEGTMNDKGIGLCQEATAEDDEKW